MVGIDLHVCSGLCAAAVAGTHDVESAEDGGGGKKDPVEKKRCQRGSALLGLLQFSLRLQPILLFSKGEDDVPFERGKHNGRNHDIAHIAVAQYQVMVEDRQRNESSEPE